MASAKIMPRRKMPQYEIARRECAGSGI